MNILFFHRWVGLHEGGTETEIKLMSSYLSDKGHNVGVLTLAGKSTADFSPRINKYYLNKFPGESSYSYDIRDPRLYFYTLFFIFQSLAWLIISYFFYHRRFDLISVHFYTESIVARIFRRLTGTPYVFVLEGYTKREAREARNANKVFCISKNDQEMCYKDFGYRPLLKPVGIDLTRWLGVERDVSLRSRFASDLDTLCLTVCRLEPRKDLTTLIMAAKLVREFKQSIKFLIVGEGISSRDLKELVDKLGLKETVMFAGRVSEAELVKYYRIGDIFVLPTLYEGFGIVYLEAMASSLPIISTNVGAVPEVIGSCGMIIQPKDPNKLASAILELIKDPAKQQLMRENGLNKVKTEYNRENILSAYLEECLKLVK